MIDHLRSLPPRNREAPGLYPVEDEFELSNIAGQLGGVIEPRTPRAVLLPDLLPDAIEQDAIGTYEEHLPPRNPIKFQHCKVLSDTEKDGDLLISRPVP
jgi:hypothetical protein